MTVVDGFNFYRDYKAGETLEDRKMAAYTGDERTVVDLLIDQIEFADGVYLNTPAPLAATAGPLASASCSRTWLLPLNRVHDQCLC